ncbi:hypothetical protein DSO57_1037596 [Entomophthora muscae]|uniref:Uncharacterized protein n=1 Tax=Entomophthora muscae TaxID=34485 RepID=A0ACC2RPS9_9FUNG|nr:hypothetical protein DSO57_1037596 [Entomophthora muscae]
MKLFVVLLAYGSLALKGSDLANCKLIKTGLSAQKEYLDIATVSLSTNDCASGKCQLPKDSLSGCRNVSVLPSFIVKDKSQEKLTALMHGTEGKHSYEGINYDFSSFAGSVTAYLSSVDKDLLKASTLTVDFNYMPDNKKLYDYVDLIGFIPSFKAVFIKNPDLEHPLLKKGGSDIVFSYTDVMTDGFYFKPNCYLIIDYNQLKSIQYELRKVNLVIEEKKPLFPYQKDLNGDVPNEAVWYRKVQSTQELAS